MRKLKTKIKRALFAFFKEELMEAAGHLPYQQQTRIVLKEAEVHEISSEIVMQNDEEYLNFDHFYNQAIDHTKHDLFLKMIKFMVVDSDDLLSRTYFGQKRIKVSIHLAKIKR